MVEIGDDIIDSRDVIARLAELEEAAAEDPSDLGCASCQEGSGPDEEIPSLCPECADELRTWRTFAEEGEGIATDWPYGEAFIRDSYFTEYAQQMAEDIGAIASDAQWPVYAIDWERAARDLQVDYSSIEVDGITYWAR